MPRQGQALLTAYYIAHQTLDWGAGGAGGSAAQDLRPRHRLSAGVQRGAADQATE